MANRSWGKVLVLGLGKSGRAVASYFSGLVGSCVDSVFIAAGARCDSAEEFLGQVARPGVAWAFGDDALRSVEGEFDLCVASPGIPCWHELYRQGERLSKELISEVELAWRLSDDDATWIAITGTNGKTTTTSLTAHVLKCCGLDADAVGNIGDVCLEAVLAGKTDVYVAEVSSYQLFSAPRFAPDIAVELNITPDHLHWHRTLEAYRDAKFGMLDNMGNCAGEGALPRRVAVLDATNDVVRAKVRELKGEGEAARGFAYIPMGTADGISGDMRSRCGARNAAFIDDAGTLVVSFEGREHAILNVSELKLKGAHNASNALAAACVAVALGLDDGRIAQALRSFEPLEHRIEPCGEVGGVHCYNDSKATNVDATVKALESFPSQRVVVMLGGDDKGTDLSDLVSAVYANAAAAVCFGDGGPRIFGALRSASSEAPADFMLKQASHLQDALDSALAIARSGDVVLLSPACASFDEFSSFEQRGRVFKDLVSTRAEG